MRMSEEMTDLELAQMNEPTPERYAKGDILTYGKAEWSPDVVDERATIPTAKAIAMHRPRIIKLLRKGVIDNEQYIACFTFRNYWQANRNDVIQRAKIATWQHAGQPRSEWQNDIELILHKQWCYNYLRNPDNGIDVEEMNVLEKVVCDEMTVHKSMRGYDHTKTGRFVAMVDKLKRCIDQINAGHSSES